MLQGSVDRSVVGCLTLQVLILLSGLPQDHAIAQSEQTVNRAIDSVTSRRENSWQLARKIWTAAEPGYQEETSARLLADAAEAAGMRVTFGVAEIPTAFTAEFGSGEPVIGVMGEYDALPGLSQQAVPEPLMREDTHNWGHGCGHHLFGTASLSAAIAIAEQIREGRLSGTIRYYGCPAEEGGSAKVFLARAGLFSDCAAVLHWHPSSMNTAGDRSSLARIAVKFQFRGKMSHAAGAPELGRSSLDAVELTAHASELLREHTPEGSRIHHVITAGGLAPNVVPAFSEIYFYVRHPDGEIVRSLYSRLEKCAEAGALATETELTIRYEGGIREILPNRTLSEVLRRRLMELNDLKYDDEEIQFAARLRQHLDFEVPLTELARVEDVAGVVGMGSTDVGDVSWVVPVSGFTTACWVPGTPAHSWQAVAAGGMTIGEKGMHLAARTLAAGLVDLFTSPQTLREAKQEMQSRLGGNSWKSLMQPGQQPPLDYRKAPTPGGE